MKIRLEEYEDKLQEITTDVISLKDSNELLNRCNEGLFLQMEQDKEKYDRQLQDISKQVKTFGVFELNFSLCNIFSISS